MAKKKKVLDALTLRNDSEESRMILALETNPKYSLEPDPTGELKLADEQKEFIRYYIEYKDIGIASQAAEIDENIGRTYYMNTTIKSEIRRINLALYYRQFSRRMLTYDELGGYLTSLLIDIDVPLSQQLQPRDKLTVAKMLIDLNKIKDEEMRNPKAMEYTDVQASVKTMDVESIKKMIENVKNVQSTSTVDLKNNQTGGNESKEELIDELNRDKNFDPSQLAYLKTLSVKELKELKEKQDNYMNDRREEDEERDAESVDAEDIHEEETQS